MDISSQPHHMTQGLVCSQGFVLFLITCLQCASRTVLELVIEIVLFLTIDFREQR